MSAETVEADEDTDDSEERPSSPTVDALKTVIGASILEKTVEVADSAGDESVIRYGDHGLKCRLVGPANAYMVNLHLEDAAFEAVGEGMFPAGTNHEAFLDFIGKADSDDPIELSFDTETRRLSVEFQPFERDFALIDPDAIRDEPDINEIELPNRFEISAKLLKEVVDVSQLVSDHVEIQGAPNDECVRVFADGDRDTNTATLDEELDFADVQEECSSLLSLDYLEDAVKPIPKSAVVEVRFGEEFPVFLTWEYADGNGHVEQMIAPRVTTR